MNQVTSDRFSLVRTAVITTVLSLGAGTSLAQERPPDPDPGTTPQAFPAESHPAGTVFPEIFGNVSGHPKTGLSVACKTADKILLHPATADTLS
jgi:hypothetical protein